MRDTEVAETIKPRLLGIPAAQRYSGMSRAALYREAKALRLEMVKQGRKTLVSVASLDALIDSLPGASLRAKKEA